MYVRFVVIIVVRNHPQSHIIGVGERDPKKKTKHCIMSGWKKDIGEREKKSKKEIGEKESGRKQKQKQKHECGRQMVSKHNEYKLKISQGGAI